MTAIEYEAERLEFRDSLRRLLHRHAPTDWARSPQTPAGEYDRRLWTLLTEQAGVAGLAVPEEFGGSGAGYLECHLVLGELGRALVASPFLASSVLSTQALLLCSGPGIENPAAAELLTELAAGTTTAALAWNPHPGKDPIPLVATRAGGSWVLDGRVRPVLDGARADRLLAFAQVQSGTALFQLDIAHPGLHRDRLPTMDQSLELAEVSCSSVPALRLATADAKVLARLTDLAAVALAAEQAAGARHCLELTVEYVKQRVQFGRPIGSFQAIKHRLADLLVLVESADSASQAAAQAWADTTDDASMLASLAKSYCSQTYRTVAGEAVQLHGGIGFTWEHQAHRYFKRAHSTSTLFGDPSFHRRRLADHLGLTQDH